MNNLHNIHNLHIDIWNIIFKYLKVEDLFNFSITDKNNYNISHQITIFKDLVKKGQDPGYLYHYLKKKNHNKNKIKFIKEWQNIPYKMKIFLDKDLKQLINIKNKKNCSHLTVYQKRTKNIYQKKKNLIDDDNYDNYNNYNKTMCLWDKCELSHLSYICFDNYKKTINFIKLSNLYKLELIGYDYEIDLNLLKKIKILIFNDCKCINDVSPLANNNYLQFEWCNNLVDVSPLKNVNTIKLYNCINIISIDSLSKVKKLHIYALHKVNNIDNLKYNKVLVIDNYPYKGLNDLIKHYMNKKDQILRVYS